ncbi:hypothetical protein FQN54_008832 [Arachnomyces sp. PD_36]|nr:hypothetical protein FQN54_008832 [Arachnomyces sp. PD_36]
MPNTGKPSRGCANCKKRRIKVSKCGEERPECRACIRTGRNCPGYLDVFDLALRDGTSQVQKKYRSPQLENPVRTSDLAGLLSGAGRVSNSPNGNWDPSATISLRDMPAPSIEELAMGFFLNRIAGPLRDPRSQWGFMGYIPSAYSRAPCGSPLSVATATFALVLFSVYFCRTAALDAAQRLFPKVVTLTQDAIQDPVESKSNETLMTVILMALYEDVKGTFDLHRPLAVHLNGAIALLRHRGRGNFNDKLSIALACAVQGKTITDAFRSSHPPTPKLNIWNELGILTNQHPHALLGSLSVELPDLRASMDEIMSNPYASDESIITLLEFATRVDQTLAQWPSLIPDSWTPKPIAHVLSPNIQENSDIYENSCDVYPDIWTANVWNSYRCSRISTQQAIIKCLSKLLPTKDIQERIALCRSTVQSLVDRICASVPFHIGIRKVGQGHSQDKVYPYTGDPAKRDEHIRTTSSMGKVLIFRSFEIIVLERLVLRDGQIAWMRDRLHDLKGFTGAGAASFYC